MPVSLWKFGSVFAKLFGRKTLLSELQRRIGYTFSDTSLLVESLAHRSYVKTAVNPESPSFERLEFLGDSVLGMLVAEQLFLMYPDKPEGELTKLKASLVNEQALSMIARDMHLGEFIKLSDDEANAGGRERPSITSDCFEALLAAIYLDGGNKRARQFVRRFVIPRIPDVQNDVSIRNYKGELLELVQAEAAGVPHYDVVDESGPDHQKEFTVVVNAFGITLAQGTGHSKKEAEQDAARKALSKARRIAKEKHMNLDQQEDK
jgi:ribonuclease-3